MDRNVLDVIEREIDDEVRTRFPGGAVRQVALLQYGDDPQIEPRDLWVRVLLDSDGPQDYDRSWKAFAGTHQAAIEEFPRYLADKVHEIMNVEFRFGDAVAGCDRDGPQYGYPTGRRLSDYQDWERGAATFVRAPMGPAGLETLDTLIMAGIAGTRTEAIRWAMDRFRDHPAFERLRERVRDADTLRDEFSAGDGSPRQAAGTDRDVLDAIEREIDDEAKTRFPDGMVHRVLLLQYGDDPEIEPGDLWVRVIPTADGPEDWQRSLDAFCDTHEAAIDQFVSYLAEKLCQIRIVEFTFNVPVTRDGHCPRMSRGVAQKLSDYRRESLGEDIFELTRLGPAGLETVDTLIMAGIADTRGEAIRRALDLIRELPAYERLGEHVRETGRLIDEFSAQGG
jgi:hypothetical protein